MGLCWGMKTGAYVDAPGVVVTGLPLVSDGEWNPGGFVWGYENRGVCGRPWGCCNWASVGLRW